MGDANSDVVVVFARGSPTGRFRRFSRIPIIFITIPTDKPVGHTKSIVQVMDTEKNVMTYE